jgi:hypothetical protein
MNAKRLVIGLGLLLSAAACGDAAPPLLPAGPSFDGGHTLGSGTRAGDGSSTTQTDTTQRGGHTLGSGT